MAFLISEPWAVPLPAAPLTPGSVRPVWTEVGWSHADGSGCVWAGVWGDVVLPIVKLSRLGLSENKGGDFQQGKGTWWEKQSFLLDDNLFHQQVLFCPSSFFIKPVPFSQIRVWEGRWVRLFVLLFSSPHQLAPPHAYPKLMVSGFFFPIVHMLAEVGPPIHNNCLVPAFLVTYSFLV